MATNQNHFTPSNKKEIFEILNGVNYKFRQIGSIHTEGMGLYFDDKSKEPKWHISIHSSNEGYWLVYGEHSKNDEKLKLKDKQTCKYFEDVLSTLKLYREKLDNLGLEKAPQQKPIYFKYAICNSSNSWYLTKTNKFNYFYCPQGSDYYEIRKLFLNSLALFDTAEDAKKYVYQNKKDIIGKNTVDIIQIKIEDESHYHFGRKSIIHIKNYNEDIDEYDMEIDGIDLYYNNNIIGQLGVTKDHKYNGEIALVSNLSKRFIQSVMHYLYSTLRVIEWKKPTILSSPIEVEDKYFGYNPSDIYTDDIDVVYGSKTIGYCGTKDRHFTGEIRFKDGVDDNLKKAVLYKFNNSSLYNDVEWREVGKIEESIENRLAENFANELKNLQKEGLFENINSFELSLKGNKLNIKLNENENEQNLKYYCTTASKYPLTASYLSQISDCEPWYSFGFFGAFGFFRSLADNESEADWMEEDCWEYHLDPNLIVIKLGEMGSEQFLAKYFDSSETIMAMDEFEAESIKTEDGEYLMDLFATKFADAIEYGKKLYLEASKAVYKEANRLRSKPSYDSDF